ncbi:MAG: hypothetical protein ACF8Q5_13000 [Phycisphaerales bacterium JB040]
MAHPRADDFRPALVLSDAGLASLVAGAMIAEEGASSGAETSPGAVWAYPAHPAFSKPLGAACERGASRQAEALGLEFLGLATSSPASSAARFGIPGQEQSTLLLMAAYAAARAGLRRVVWPVQAVDHTGEIDLDAAGAATDRALLVSRLVTLDLEGRDTPVQEVVIETPLVDLTDEQIAGLALDLAAPVSLCWWWGGRTADLPLAESEWERWAARLGASTGDLREPKPASVFAPE